MSNKIDVLKEEAILGLAKKDLDNFNKNEKSYELLNWLRDELVIRQVNKKTTFIVSAKAFSRMINILAMFRENSLTKLDIKISDRNTVLINFEYDLTTLSNAQRYLLNNQYNLGLEEMTEEEKDETYSHMI